MAAYDEMVICWTLPVLLLVQSVSAKIASVPVSVDIEAPVLLKICAVTASPASSFKSTVKWRVRGRSFPLKACISLLGAFLLNPLTRTPSRMMPSAATAPAATPAEMVKE